MTRSLFRAEALESQKQHHEFGHVGRLQPLSLAVLAWFLVAAIGALLIFICIVGYTRKETVAGYLAPASGTAEVFVPQQGTVTAVHVSADQLVDQGDILLVIDTSRITASGIDVNEAVLKGLSVQKVLLTNQIDAEERSMRAEKIRLADAIKNGEAELAQLSSQMDFQQDQIDMAQKLVDNAKQMHESGYLSDPDFYKRQEELLEAKRGLSSLKQRYSARETELAQTQNSLDQLPTESARRLQPLRSELAEIDQRIAESSGHQSFAIRAPIAGRIANLQATVGQIADPESVQLEILPLDSPLEATLFVPTRAIGFVQPGQEVRLLYDAFPYQRFGTYSGRIISVSKTILTEAGVSATGAELAVLKGHDELVSSAAFSPDGTKVVTAFGDKTARVWDLTKLENGEGFGIACQRLGNNTDLAGVRARYTLGEIAPICGDYAPLAVDLSKLK